MKLVLPHGGYGLGNDLIPWAKGFILAQELGARLLHPAWGNNPRKYYKYFRTFPYDYQVYRILRRTLPRYRFTEEDYRTIGIDSFSESCKVFVRNYDLKNKQNYIIEITGFWGAFEGIGAATDFIISCLSNTAHTQENISTIKKKLHKDKLTVGIHVRLGDFWQAGQLDYPGAEQISIPLDWYCYIRDELGASLGSENVQFIICSDGRIEELTELVDRSNALFASSLPNSDISDLFLLKNADLLICSISSYSMWAAFLSNSPYVWYRPNLIDSQDGYVNKFVRSLGIYTPIQGFNKSVAGRGVALSIGDPFPNHLIDHLRILHRNKQARFDLIRGGAIS